MNFIKLKLTVFVAIISMSSYSQDTISISKSELSEKIKNNLQLKISKNDYDASKQDYKQSNSLFCPTSPFHTLEF